MKGSLCCMSGSFACICQKFNYAKGLFLDTFTDITSGAIAKIKKAGDKIDK